MSQHPVYDLETVRAAFPMAAQTTYLNHASVSPIPQPAQDVFQRMAELGSLDPASLMAPQPPYNESIFVTFSRVIAELINAADLHEVVGATSTSAAINTVAQSIDWQPGDGVLLVDTEFPSNVYPWLVLARRGVDVRVVPADQGGASVAAFAPYVDDRTRLIAVSAIQFLTGHRADLAALGTFCKERGIILAVDAIQAAGHIPIDVQAMQIDILAAGGQKSLMGPQGQGFLYVRKGLAEQIQPAVIGPNAVEGWDHWLKYDLTPRAAAWRFMLGTPNIVGMFALVASIEFLRNLGLPNIDAWTHHLAQVAMDDLTARGWNLITPTDPARFGPIVTFQVGDPADPAASSAYAAALVKHLEAHNIRVLNHLNREGVGHLRISTHCYNTEDEVRRVGAALEEHTHVK